MNQYGSGSNVILRTREQGIDFRQRVLHFVTTSRPGMGPTQSSSQWVQVLFLDEKAADA